MAEPRRSPHPRDLALPTGYTALLGELKDWVRAARTTALRTVNTQLINMWKVPKSIDGVAGVVPEWYEAPTFYITNPHTVTGTGEVIGIPAGCADLDFETEVAAVVGRVPGSDGRNLTAAEAHGHIFGYTVLNDWSARDLQRREMKVSLGPCKGKDFANALGPWIVTADEFKDLHDAEGFLPISMVVEVNGEPIGQDLLSNMGWPFAELVCGLAMCWAPACAAAVVSRSSGDGTAQNAPSAQDRRPGEDDGGRHRKH